MQNYLFKGSNLNAAKRDSLGSLTDQDFLFSWKASVKELPSIKPEVLGTIRNCTKFCRTLAKLRETQALFIIITNPASWSAEGVWWGSCEVRKSTYSFCCISVLNLRLKTFVSNFYKNSYFLSLFVVSNS